MWFTDTFRQSVLLFQLVSDKLIGERSLFHAGGIYGKQAAHPDPPGCSGESGDRGRLTSLRLF